MKKNSTKSYKQISDFFGYKNEYYIFAVKSNLSLFPFASQFETITNSHFSFLTKIISNHTSNVAEFNVMYSLISKEDNAHCYIIENKTTQYTNKEVIQASSEKKLPFQTLPLFDDVLYLINKEGFSIFKSPLPYYDFLILFYNQKNRDISSIYNTLIEQKNYKTIDISGLLEKNKKKIENSIQDFLQTTFCSLEVSTTNFQQKQTLYKIGSVAKIPDENIAHPLKLQIESKIVDNLTYNFNSDYLRLITNEVDSL